MYTQRLSPTQALPVLLLALAISCMRAEAANLAYEATAGVGQSDNIARAADDEQDETVATAGLRFSVDQRSSRIEADAVGDLAYYDYLDDTYGSEMLGTLTASLRAAIIEERLHWVLNDNFGQVLNDPFTPATPENRENLNYFSTGPELTFAFGTQTRFQAGARYARADYENLPLDSTSLMASAGLERDITRGSSLGLFARHQQLEYESSLLDVDYDQREGFLRYSALGARTRLQLDVGFTEIDREGMSESQDSALLRFEGERRMTARTSLRLDAGRQFASSGSAFAAEQSGSPAGLDSAGGRQTFDPFIDEYVRVGWDYAGSRTELSFGGGWREQGYETDPDLDQSLSTLDASVRRHISPMVSIELGARQSESEFEQPGRDYSDLSVSLSLDWRLSRMLTARLSFDRQDRDSDDALAGFTENRIWLSLGYGRGAPRGRLLGTKFAVDAATEEP
jgi:hypothetical protein